MKIWCDVGEHYVDKDKIEISKDSTDYCHSLNICEDCLIP